jgi:hypothetical protein
LPAAEAPAKKLGSPTPRPGGRYAVPDPLVEKRCARFVIEAKELIMRTKNYMDIDEVIEYRRDALYSADNDVDRGICERLLDQAIAERDAARAELRASPGWDELPF